MLTGDQLNVNLPRLYSDLAWVWPLWEELDQYRPDADFYTELIRKYARGQVNTLLDLGCGGGKADYHLKENFKITGVDISLAMLENARRLNGDCEYMLGDVRSVRLERVFDAVLVNDAVSYMTDKVQLGQVFATARRHLRRGGVMIVGADHTKESFIQNEITVSKGGGDGVEITFIENLYDANPADTICELLLIFIIRQSGKLRVEKDLHTLGLFEEPVWTEQIQNAGFKPRRHLFITEEAGAKREYTFFACVRD